MRAISRADLTTSCSTVENGRICSEHFISGKPAALFDETNPSWLPTEKLGHEKVSRKRVAASQERYQRKRARQERRLAAQRVPYVEADCVRTVRSDEAVVNVDAVDLNAIEVAGHGLVAVEGTDLNAVEDAAEGASHGLGMDAAGIENQMKEPVV